MTRPDRILLCVDTGEPARDRELLATARRAGLERFARRSGARWSWDGEGTPVAVTEVHDPDALERALAAAPPGSIRLFRWTGDRIIPLENALAFAAPGVRVLVVADDAEQVPAALGALERGAERVLLRVTSPDELLRLLPLLDPVLPERLAWRSARVTRIEPAGTTERVLVDTTSLLDPHEGLLVGSVARWLFGVASEAEGSKFSQPRPFRVNAGAPHSYTLLADGTTRYLAELAPGDRLLATVPRGRPRMVRVGRVKIEHRPMRLVEAVAGGRSATVFLQEAETVRLMGPRGNLALPKLRVGDTVLGVELPEARHLGTAVAERVEER